MYSTDLTDSQWEVIEEILNDQRKRKYSLRVVMNALFYLLTTGCQWRMLPKEYPPYRLVHYYFRKWRDNGQLERINQKLNRNFRLSRGRKSSPSTGILDAQSVKNSEWGLPDKGYDGHKHIQGRKRQLIVDTLGLILAAFVHPANWHDSKGGFDVLERLKKQRYRRIKQIIADYGYRGSLINWAKEQFNWDLQIVKTHTRKNENFTPLPQRWKVERTISWLQWHRRLAKDYEAYPESSEAYIYLSNILRVIRNF